MSIETVGSVIAALRKEKSVTQEELADCVGVSAQAVSKWENGGAPDCALLPSIADFFGVSIDALFGRSLTDYSGVEGALTKKIMATPEAEKLDLLYSLCWTMQMALFDESAGNYSLETLYASEKFRGTEDSEFHHPNGYTMVGLGERLPYFFLLPKTPDFEQFQLSENDFCAFFKALSDRAVFDALVLLIKQPTGKFTAKRLVEKLGISEEKANEVISVLLRYHLLFSEEIEIDDTVYTIYTVPTGNTSVFTPILLFAQRFIRGNKGFYFYAGGYPCLK